MFSDTEKPRRMHSTLQDLADKYMCERKVSYSLFHTLLNVLTTQEACAPQFFPSQAPLLVEAVVEAGSR